MTIAIDPIVGRSPIRLDVAPTLRGVLFRMANGRPLVIDYHATRIRGLTVGDLTVRFDAALREPRYLELEPIEGVRIVAERRLVGLLAEGATLWRPRLAVFGALSIALAHPDHWIDFLERHPPAR